MEAPLYPKQYLYRRIVQAKLFIDEHYSENADLDNIAEEAYFSKFHFIRLFKKMYGYTPHQYLIVVRIEKAKLLLQQDNKVADACFQVGFDSITSFTTLFRKKTGMTPAEYQFRHKQMQAMMSKEPLRFIPNCFAEKKGWTNND